MFSILAAVHHKTGGIGFEVRQPWIDDTPYYLNYVSSLVSRPALKRNALIMDVYTFFQWMNKGAFVFEHTLNIVLCEADAHILISPSLCRFARTREEYDRIQSELCSQVYEGELCSSPPVIFLKLSSLDEAMDYISQEGTSDKTFVLGGEKLFAEAWTHPKWSRELLLTEVDDVLELGDPPCFDAFFPVRDLFSRADKYQTQFSKETIGIWKTDTNSRWSFLHHRLIMASASAFEEEVNYLRLVRRVMQEGIDRTDRTQTGTRSLFGERLEFSLTDRFPLFTTKKVHFLNILRELLWFVSGSTNANVLQAQNVNIWSANGSRAFLDQRGLSHREEGDLGPVYGFQWRHFGATYQDMHADYSGQGVDQLAECIRQIRTNPSDRRILMSAWNPAQLSEMALPPCHVLVQFYVDETRGLLHCQMYQRSADLGLGVPYNIASYAILTYMVAHICGLKPGKLVMVFGDAHVYLNHLEALQKQVEREPYPFPRLSIRRREDLREIDDFREDDFVLEDYRYHPFLAMKMAV